MKIGGVQEERQERWEEYVPRRCVPSKKQRTTLYLAGSVTSGNNLGSVQVKSSESNSGQPKVQMKSGPGQMSVGLQKQICYE